MDSLAEPARGERAPDENPTQREFRWVLEAGMGALLHRAVTRSILRVPAAWHDVLLSAELTAQVRHGGAISATNEVIDVCRELGAPVTLLKGISVSEQCYPAGHQRPIPDFEGDEEALAQVCAEQPEILNHNIETVRRLFPPIRPQGKYQRSIDLLARAKQHGMKTKSGLILGMGETLDEAREVMCDLRTVDCDIITIGQYLQPTKEHLPVERYVRPEEFGELRDAGLVMGFRVVESGPLVRSSYHAERHVKGPGWLDSGGFFR